MALIEVHNLFKTYVNEGVETPALRGLNFSIEKGAFVAIMGPSGSGKSTLLHVLGFLDPQSSGDYLFDGKEFSDLSEKEVAEMRNEKFGFVFQSFNLLAKTSVYDNVRLPLIYSGVPERDWHGMILKAVESVGLTHRINHQSSQLSGGEKQRAAIARALVLKPGVIFADEPTGNLDSVSGGVVMNILRDLNETRGHTIILITHETYTAEHAGRILALRDGIIETDKEVVKRFKSGEGLIK